MPFAELYWPARSMASTLGNKEFDEEDFFVSGPTRLTYTAQPITGKVNKTLGTVKVALLDGFGNVMTMDTGGGASTIAVGVASGPAGGTLNSASGPGGLTKSLSQGVATWTDLKLSAPTGVYKLKADSSVSGVPDETQPARQRHQLIRSSGQDPAWIPPNGSVPPRPGRSRHRPGRRDAPMRPAIVAATAIAPTTATARNSADPLPPDWTVTTIGVGAADVEAAADGDGDDAGTSDGATGLKSGGSVPGGGVGGSEPLGASFAGAAVTMILPRTVGSPLS